MLSFQRGNKILNLIRNFGIKKFLNFLFTFKKFNLFQTLIFFTKNKFLSFKIYFILFTN